MRGLKTHCRRIDGAEGEGRREVTIMPFVCSHDPRTRAGEPIGMYHCPGTCGGLMVLAGVNHPAVRRYEPGQLGMPEHDITDRPERWTD